MPGFGTLSPGEDAMTADELAALQSGNALSKGWSMLGGLAMLPKRVIDAAAVAPAPGLRREDFTDVPSNTAPDPNSPLGGVGVPFGRIGWQPGDELIGQSLETAANVMGGTSLSAPARAGEAAVGAGPVGRMRMIDNADQLKEIANQNRAKGYATGKPAAGWEFKRPDPAKGSFAQAAIEARAGFKSDAGEAMNEYLRTAPANPLMTPDDWKFIDENIARGNPTLGAGAADKRAAAATAALDMSPEARMAADRRGAAVLASDLHAPTTPVAPTIPPMTVEAGQGAQEAYASLHGKLPETTTPAATPAIPGANVPGGAGGGVPGLSEAQAAAARWAGTRKPLEGLPTKAMKIGDEHFVPGPIGSIHDVAEAYMKGLDRPYTPPTKYHPIDEDHSRAIARAFEEMPHTPDDPATKASYDALIKETQAQYNAIKGTGLKIEPIRPDMPDPYAANPRLAAKDVAENNHLWYFPTESGFGSGATSLEGHPMMRATGETIGDKPLLANDMFRIVHDYFGHLKEGHGFRAAGEDNAYRTHSAMYSDLARPAMTTETRGQNSWVNYGPHGETNRKASAADTVYADQKVGLMPEWTMRDRGSPEPIIAYHGTPHSFDEFSAKNIGGGEGNQAYGHGLYFAGHEPVSEWYRHQLAARRDPLLSKYGLDTEDGANVGMQIAAHGGDAEAYKAKLQQHLDILKGQNDTSKAQQNAIANTEGKIAFLSDPNRSKGHLYQVAIDHPPEKLLDWDAPLGEQSPAVKEAIRAIYPDIPISSRRPVGQLYDNLVSARGAKAATAAFKEAGVAGIKYLDQGSRGGAKGTHNYVTFDAPRILRKYGIPSMIGAGGFGSLARPGDDR